MVYKSLNGLAREYLRSMFTDRTQISTYSPRDTKGKVAVPLRGANFRKNSLTCRGAVLWNSAPAKPQQAQTLASNYGCSVFFPGKE